MKSVTHLHFHTEYSLRDSVIKIDQLPDLIRKRNVRAIAITDHGNVDGAVKFYQKTKDIKLEDGTEFVPLLGCELYVVDDYTDRKDRFRYHLTVIAKNLKGFRSIMKLLTIANLEGFYYMPRTSWDCILDNLEDVVVMTACTGGLLRHPNYWDLIQRFKDKYGEDFYLEAILLEDYEPYKERNELVKYLSERTKVPIAFTNDVHFPSKNDWTAREICFAIQYHKDIDPIKYKEKTADKTDCMYLKNYDEVVESLKEFGFEDREEEMNKVWDEIVGKCKCNWLKQMKVMVPVAYEKAKTNPEEYLREICRERFEQKRQKEEFRDEEEALKRMEHELKEICDLGFAEYFLLVADMVKEIKAKGIMVGVGRGTVGASIVAWLLGITGINPLNYDLMFERFISPGRHDLPDIDLDFEDVKRGEVLEYLQQRYEKENVALVSTFSTMKGRLALRDVSRVFGVPLSEVDAAAKQILVRSGGDARASFSIEDTMNLFEIAKKFKKKYPKVVEEAAKLEGLLKNKGIHAAGMVVDTKDLHEGTKCVLVRGRRENEDEVVVNWDKKDLEYMGLMKIDVLGLKTLNILKIIQELVKERHNKEIHWEEHIPLDEEKDPKIIEKFQRGESVGVFQLGTAGMIQYLKNFMPKNFRELYQVNALFRPGTLRSGMATEFIQFKKNPERVKYINDELKAILKETYGIVLFQEQIMYILNKLGNIPWRTADTVRKVVSKSEGQEKFETFRGQFLKGVRELNSMSADDANKIFGLMKFFGSYGFNKAHAVEYTILGWWTMWAKVYYPLEFYCANLMREGDKEAISALLNDIERRVDVEIALPHINKSGKTWKIEGEKTLRAGFDIMKGISSRLSAEVVETRKEVGGEWKSFKHFYSTVPKRVVNIAKVKTLLLADAFGDWFTDEERKKMVVYIEKNKKVPAEPKQLDTVDAAEFEELEISKQEVFNYELAQAFFEQNKNLVKLIEDKYGTVKLDKMKEVKDEGTLKESWFIGKFDEIKYGYRTAVDKSKETVETKGYADDLGGVYGIFRDDTYLYYTTFTKDLYHMKAYKGRIEDIAGKYLLLKAGKPTRATNLFVKEVHFFDDIKKGEFAESLNLKGLIQYQKEDYKELREGIKTCSECEGRKLCNATTPFSCGEFGAMIIGRDPGREEEKAGVPFVGAAGRLFWDIVKKSTGLEREWFYVTNLQKCRPEGNNYNEKNSQFCRAQWLEKEIKEIKPRLILCLGSQACQYVTGNKKAKITEKTGTAEWNERFGAWIVYSVHPAALLYGESHETVQLEEALKKFEKLFKKLIEI